MGSAGSVKKAKESKYVNEPTHDANDLEGVTQFLSGFDYSDMNATDKWFANPKLSNYDEWNNNLTKQEKDAIEYFTGSGYTGLNLDLYGKKWDDMSSYKKEKAINLYNAINKFELNKTINVSRATDLEYIGGSHSIDDLKAYLEKNSLLQFNGFQSTSTGSEPAFSGKLVIHYQIPPSKGAGAYVRPISEHPSEKEFLLNNNGVFQFDPNSIKKDGYRIHVNAVWVGQAADQAFTDNK